MSPKKSACHTGDIILSVLQIRKLGLSEVKHAYRLCTDTQGTGTQSHLKDSILVHDFPSNCPYWVPAMFQGLWNRWEAMFGPRSVICI